MHTRKQKQPSGARARKLWASQRPSRRASLPEAGRVKAVLFTLLLVLGVSLGAGAEESLAQDRTVIYVDNAVTAGGDGTSWESAFKYLQDALDVANATDTSVAVTVKLAEGLYYPDEDQDGDQVDDDEDARFSINRNMHIIGGYPSGGGDRNPSEHLSILSGDIDQNADYIPTSEGIVESHNHNYSTRASKTLLHFDREQPYEDFLIDGIVLTGQYRSANNSDESALYLLSFEECNFEARNIIVAGNLSGGAPLFISRCHVKISNARFFGNESTGLRAGGAATIKTFYQEFDEPVEITNSSFENNAGDAGAISFEQSVNDEHEILITNSTFHANEGDYAAAIYTGDVKYGWPKISNVVFEGNVATDTEEDAVWYSSDADSYPTFNNVVSDVALPSSILREGTIEENVDPGITATVTTPGPDGPRRYQMPATLESSSPAVDAGSADLLPADAADLDGDGDTAEPSPLDVLGKYRVRGAEVDMGAYESSSIDGTYNNMEPAPPLEPPASISATPGDGEVEVSWQSVEEATGYNVYRSASDFSDPADATKLTGSPVSETSYTDATAQNGETYYYGVTSTDGSEESDLSETRAATPQAPTPPDAPDQLEIVVDEVNDVASLSWSEVSGAEGYHVYRGTERFSDPEGATQVTSSPLAEASYDETSYEKDTRYYYRVTALGEDDLESSASNLVSFMQSSEPGDDPQEGPSDPPTSVSATITEGQVTITWNTASVEVAQAENAQGEKAQAQTVSSKSQPSGANVYRSNEPFDSPSEADKLNDEPVTTGKYVDTGLDPDKQYYYRVAQVSSAGDVGPLSDAIEVDGEEAAPPLFEVVRFDAESSSIDEGVRLVWETREDEVNDYVVERNVTLNSGATTGFSAVSTIQGKAEDGKNSYTYSHVDEDLPYEAKMVSYRLSRAQDQASPEPLETIEVELDGPEEIKFFGNAPNPFRSQTTIRYELPTTQEVRIAVYNALGQEIAVLVDESQSGGRQAVTFTAQNLSSGLYLVRFTAGEVTKTKRMVHVQ